MQLNQIKRAGVSAPLTDFARNVAWGTASKSRFKGILGVDPPLGALFNGIARPRGIITMPSFFNSSGGSPSSHRHTLVWPRCPAGFVCLAWFRRERLCENCRWPTQTDRSLQLQAASTSSVLARSIFFDAWAFPGRRLSSNTESDLDTNVVRALMQPEGCGPPEFSHSLERPQQRL